MEETATKSPVTLTDKAVEKVKEFKAKEDRPDSGLRLGVQGGGCSGFSYQLALDDGPAEGDMVFESSGEKVFVDPTSFPYLQGTVIDFVDTALGGGFDFKNPNSAGSCGCGKSFEV